MVLTHLLCESEILASSLHCFGSRRLANGAENWGAIVVASLAVVWSRSVYRMVGLDRRWCKSAGMVDPVLSATRCNTCSMLPWGIGEHSLF